MSGMIEYTEQDRKDWEHYKRSILRTKPDDDESQVLLKDWYKGQRKRKENKAFKIEINYKEE